MPNHKDICTNCKLPLAAADRIGSFTSFVFMDLHCQCHLGRPSARPAKLGKTSDNCQTCGKVIPTHNRPGSITSFLLKDLRCNCAPVRTEQPQNLLETRYRPTRALQEQRQKSATQRHTMSSNKVSSDAALVTLQSGEIIGGCYQLAELVGKGGMGLIYKANHITLARTVALKFIAPSMVSKESWEYFKKEAKISSSLSHSTICQIYDLGIHAGVLPFYAMDFIEGRNLEEIILANGPLSVGATLEIYIKVCEGLSYAHRHQVVHKDIKPANIMVVDNDQSLQIKILDFGIAELNEGRKPAPKVENTTVVGSASYMSPEQFRGEPLDLRTDIYSLGCSIYETLSGVPPFTGATYEALCESHKRATAAKLSDVTGVGFSDKLEAIIQMCLQKNPEKRYQSANELAIDLQRVLDDKELQFARALPLLESLRPNTDQAPPQYFKILALILLPGLLLTFAGLFYVWQSSRKIDDWNKRHETYLHDVVATTESIRSDIVTAEGTEHNNVRPNQFYYCEDAASIKYNFVNLYTLMPAAFEFFHTELDQYGILNINVNQNSAMKKGQKTEMPYCHFVPCKGEVTIPRESLLILKPLLLTQQNYDYLAGFRQQDIKGLDLRSLPDLLSAKTVVDRFIKVERLIVSETQNSLTAMTELSHLKNLKELACVGWLTEPKPKGSNLVYKKLKVLHINTKGSIKNTLQGYFANAVLETIIIDQSNFNQADARYLSALKALKTLTIKDCDIKEPVIATLFHSPNLQTLYIVCDNPSGANLNLNNIEPSGAIKKFRVFSRIQPPGIPLKVINRLRQCGVDSQWEHP